MPQNLLKGAIIHLHSLFDKSHFSNICTDKGMGRNYWLPKYMKKVRSSQPAISVLNWVKYRFPRLLIKRVLKTNAKRMQRMYNERQWVVQLMATIDSDRYNEWQRVVQQVTTNDNEWQRVIKNDNEWHWMTASDKTNEYEWE